MVDAPEVQLNVSREILQNTPVIAAIRKQLVKRVLRRLKEIARDDAATYETFWESFGSTLKEGIAEDTDNKDQIVPLLRFRTTASDGWPPTIGTSACFTNGRNASTATARLPTVGALSKVEQHL